MPLEVLAKTARALGEVAAEVPEAVAVAVTPGSSWFGSVQAARVVLATSQLALLRALAAANTSWIQRTLKETPGEPENKKDVNNLTDLAATYAKTGQSAPKALHSRRRSLRILKGEANYFAASTPLEVGTQEPVRSSLSTHLEWVEHDRFKRDAEVAGVWI
ncbi:hypothetical protein AK812_SmicGene21691 [Symbiodinium microadriaticum]|uniref:Uncharacterized protein n=1 Tax=Symbiodinium microadriaticum TaxID=2951 RepID=A0A1Q9DLS1_SYMMI|nr:hypothetical protein AK812_SmicGene21691 [Symbiodinium microadriaticum]CAE7630313.1 unnamed protein product [Symbiodinium microadriaticum]CAE7813161.1 unnamed protein product [Symbiodinium sp. KB8]